MRGNTRRRFARGFPACAPRGLARASSPVHPGQEGSLPLCGTPRQRVRPFGIRAQGALLPDTPAHKGDTPLAPYPRMGGIP